jgi:periplasmic protein TonB
MKNTYIYILLIVITTGCNTYDLIAKKELRQKNYQEVIGAIDENEPIPDKCALYPNGLRGIYDHIIKTTEYPAYAFDNNIQGKVMTQFIVEKTGHITDVKIISGVTDELDAEAIRVILALERWYPGIKNGKPVRLIYQQPINFVLN